MITDLRHLHPLPNPIPPANRVAAMFIADPAIADAAAAYAKQQGGQVNSFLGFKFITMQNADDTLRKMRLIGRLEFDRKQRESAKAIEPTIPETAVRS